MLQRGIATHKRLERLVVEERGLDEVVRALSAAIGGAVLVLDPRGELLASRAFRRELPDEAVAAVREQVRRDGDGDRVRPRPPGARRPRLVAAGLRARRPARPRPGWSPPATPRASGDFERLICQQATTVVALELMRQRAMRDTERRLAGDVIADAVSGRLAGRELAGPPAALRRGRAGRGGGGLGVSGEPAGPSATLERALADAGHPGLVAESEGLLVAVASGEDLPDPVAAGAAPAQRVAPSVPR